MAAPTTLPTPATTASSSSAAPKVRAVATKTVTVDFIRDNEAYIRINGVQWKVCIYDITHDASGEQKTKLHLDEQIAEAVQEKFQSLANTGIFDINPPAGAAAKREFDPNIRKIVLEGYARPSSAPTKKNTYIMDTISTGGSSDEASPVTDLTSSGRVNARARSVLRELGETLTANDSKLHDPSTQPTASAPAAQSTAKPSPSKPASTGKRTLTVTPLERLFRGRPTAAPTTASASLVTQLGALQPAITVTEQQIRTDAAAHVKQDANEYHKEPKFSGLKEELNTIRNGINAANLTAAYEALKTSKRPLIPGPWAPKLPSTLVELLDNPSPDEANKKLIVELYARYVETHADNLGQTFLTAAAATKNIAIAILEEDATGKPAIAHYYNPLSPKQTPDNLIAQRCVFLKRNPDGTFSSYDRAAAAAATPLPKGRLKALEALNTLSAPLQPETIDITDHKDAVQNPAGRCADTSIADQILRMRSQTGNPTEREVTELATQLRRYAAQQIRSGVLSQNDHTVESLLNALSTAATEGKLPLALLHPLESQVELLKRMKEAAKNKNSASLACLYMDIQADQGHVLQIELRDKIFRKAQESHKYGGDGTASALLPPLTRLDFGGEMIRGAHVAGNTLIASEEGWGYIQEAIEEILERTGQEVNNLSYDPVHMAGGTFSPEKFIKYANQNLAHLTLGQKQLLCNLYADLIESGAGDEWLDEPFFLAVTKPIQAAQTAQAALVPPAAAATADSDLLRFVSQIAQAANTDLQGNAQRLIPETANGFRIAIVEDDGGGYKITPGAKVYGQVAPQPARPATATPKDNTAFIWYNGRDHYRSFARDSAALEEAITTSGLT